MADYDDVTRRSDDWAPLDEDQHQRQLAGLSHMLPADRTARVLDLGCGSGRVLLPLAQMGCECVGIDNDIEAIRTIETNLTDIKTDVKVRLIHGDFTGSGVNNAIADAGVFDLVLCLGNTWMLVTDPIIAIDTIGHIAGHLSLGSGRFVIDNFPGELWPLLTMGFWGSGISENNYMQLVWDDSDNVFCIRQFQNIDEGKSDEFKLNDRLNRLWTMGELRMLAHIAGLQQPVVDKASHLIYFDRVG